MRRLWLKLLLGVMGGRHRDAGPVKLWLAARFMQRFPGQIDCREFESFVYDYHEGQLAPRQREIFELHMRLCPMCRVHFDSYLRTVAMGRHVCGAADQDLPRDVPEDLVQAILAARAEH